MTLPISDPDARARIAALADNYDRANAEYQAKDATAREIAGRRAQLAQQLAAHDDAQPAPSPDVANELAAMLAANPAAADSADWEGRFREDQQATERAREAWQGKRTVLLQAIATLDGEIATARASTEAARADAIARHTLYLREAREVMLDEVEAAARVLYQEKVRYLDAISITAAVRIEPGHRLLLREGGQFTLRKITAIGHPSDTYLLPVASSAATNPELLASFRASLQPAKPARGGRPGA